jgi:hypothetical protein
MVYSVLLKVPFLGFPLLACRLLLKFGQSLRGRVGGPVIDSYLKATWGRISRTSTQLLQSPSYKYENYERDLP